MWYLSCTEGTGDTYLVCALWQAFERQHGSATILITPEQEAIARMFDVRYQVGAHGGATNVFEEGVPFIVHPNAMYLGRNIDALTGYEGFSQADMYRLLLRLPPDAPLAKPRIVEKWDDPTIPAGRTVVLMPHSRTWPPAPIEFWVELTKSILDRTDLFVVMNTNAGEFSGSPRAVTLYPPLMRLYALIEHAGWVIGPNTGGFVCAVSAELRASKTLVVQRPPGDTFQFNQVIRLNGSFPFSHQRKFDGDDYEVDEYELTDRASWEPTIERIIANRPAISPQPKRIIRAPMSIGDIVDRITILEIKAERLKSASDRLAAARELRELRETIEGIAVPAIAVAALREANIRGWDLADGMYADFPFGSDWAPDFEKQSDRDIAVAGLKAHRAMMDANRDRVRARQEIDALSGSLLREVKSYSVS